MDGGQRQGLRQGLRRGYATTTVFLATAFLAGLILGRGLEAKVLAGGEPFEEFKIFTEVLAAVQKNYVDSVNTKELVHGAIRGMLNTLDPHSAFMPPEVYKEVQVDTKGEFGGLGIQIGLKDGQPGKLIVIAPIEETPADRAGIKAGDRIIKVNDESTQNMTLFDAVQRLRGVKGSKVTLTLVREGAPEPLVVTLTREIIQLKSVKGKRLGGGIGYIRVTQFQEQTGKDLAKALRRLREEQAAQPLQALILDLRNNPGGLLTTAVEVTEQFVESGKVIVSVKARDGKKDEYVSNNRSLAERLPMVVLVNEGSASGAEIVAGALQDLKLAIILGTPTFGKGSVQTIMTLSDGSGLRLTTAKYYTPKGRSIQNTGIEPDVLFRPQAGEPKPSAPPTPPPREKELERHLKGEEKEAPQGQGSTKEPPAVGPEDDPHVQKAVELLSSWKIFKEFEVSQLKKAS